MKGEQNPTTPRKEGELESLTILAIRRLLIRVVFCSTIALDRVGLQLRLRRIGCEQPDLTVPEIANQRPV